MGTLNTEIYSLAVKQFEDPFVRRKYNGSLINMYSDLYGYLTSATAEFISPDGMIEKLQDTIPPFGQVESFSGDNETLEFTISVIPVDNSIIEVSVDGNILSDNEYEFNAEESILIFKNEPPIGEDNILFTWYYPGEYTNDLNSFEKNILCDWFIYKWTLKEKNYLPDIRRLLRDTDYQLYGENQSINSKSNLTDVAREKAEKRMKEYGWKIYRESMSEKYGVFPSYTKGRI